MRRDLLALAAGTFALGVAEFGMMGILATVAEEMRVSVVQAGHLISLYSLGVAVGAPILIFMRNMPLKRLMIVLASVIFAGNLAAALAPNFGLLLAARFLSGLPHGAYFGAGAIVCSRLAKAGHGAEAVAVMVGGMTVANLVGVPAGTYICSLLSWREVFLGVAAVGLLALVLIRIWVPRIEPLPRTNVKGQFRFLSSPAPWLIFSGRQAFIAGSVISTR